MKHRKKIEVISAPPFDWPWFERFDNIFLGIAKINGIPIVKDQGVHVMNFETKVVNVSDEKDVQTSCVPSSPERQIPMFGDDNANVETTPSVSSNSFRIRACKLPSVQRKFNKKLKWKKRRLFTSSSVITYAINKFTHVVKEIEFLKMEMTKFITPQMLQNENNGKQMMIQGQL